MPILEQPEVPIIAPGAGKCDSGGTWGGLLPSQVRAAIIVGFVSEVPDASPGTHYGMWDRPIALVDVMGALTIMMSLLTSPDRPLSEWPVDPMTLADIFSSFTKLLTSFFRPSIHNHLFLP